MSKQEGVEELEQALQQRAEKLAQEYLVSAREKRARILQEQNERLHERERQEGRRAAAEAERRRRSRVEAVRHDQQGTLEKRRWQATQNVMAAMRQALVTLADDESRYLERIKQLLSAAAQQLPDGALIVKVNARDRDRLAARWESLIGETMPGRDVSLSEDTVDCMGGVLVRDEDNRVRLDNTFEGRLDRYGRAAALRIDETLFGESTEAGLEPAWERS